MKLPLVPLALFATVLLAVLASAWPCAGAAVREPWLAGVAQISAPGTSAAAAARLDLVASDPPRDAGAGSARAPVAPPHRSGGRLDTGRPGLDRREQALLGQDLGATGAAFACLPASRRARPVARTTCDAAGAFRIEGLPPVRCAVAVVPTERCDIPFEEAGAPDVAWADCTRADARGVARNAFWNPPVEDGGR